MNISKEILDEMLNEGPLWDKSKEHVKNAIVAGGIVGGAAGAMIYKYVSSSNALNHAVNQIWNPIRLGVTTYAKEYPIDMTNLNTAMTSVQNHLENFGNMIKEVTTWMKEGKYPSVANSETLERLKEDHALLEKTKIMIHNLQNSITQTPFLYGSIATALWAGYGLVKGLSLSKKINTMNDSIKHIKDPIKKLQTRIQLLNVVKSIQIKSLDKITDQNKKNKVQNIIKKYQEDINKLTNKLSKMTHKESAELQERMNPITTSLANMIAWPIFNIIVRKKLENMYYHCNNLDKSDRKECQLQILSVLHSELNKEYNKDKGNYNIYNKIVSIEKRIKELKSK